MNPLSPAPDGIREPHLRPGGPLSRHASPISLLVLSAIMAIGLSGLLGKPTSEVTRHGTDPEVVIEMPAKVRNGDFYETSIRVHADKQVDKLQVDVSPELWRQITVNAMVPAAASESYKDGYFRFEYGALARGDSFLVKIASQVNPRLLGSVSGQIRVLDGDQVLVVAQRTMKVLP